MPAHQPEIEQIAYAQPRVQLLRSVCDFVAMAPALVVLALVAHVSLNLCSGMRSSEFCTYLHRVWVIQACGLLSQHTDRSPVGQNRTCLV